jgi:GxxExxY protein
MIVNDHLLIENKSVAALNEVHQAQVITYLKLSGLRLGLLVNWNVRLIKHGIKRIAHDLGE